MDKMQQKILCISEEVLFASGKWQGLKTDNLDSLYKTLLTQSEFRIRGELETDPKFKQIIPQVVLKCGQSYFLHRQIARAESRLNSLAPLPLGGHVEEFDLQTGKDLIEIALYRELDEEVDIAAKIISKRFLGLIYLEDEHPVNSVHVGLAYIFELDGTAVKIREEGLEDIGFVTKDYLVEHIDELTYWSKVLINHI